MLGFGGFGVKRVVLFCMQEECELLQPKGRLWLTIFKKRYYNISHSTCSSSNCYFPTKKWSFSSLSLNLGNRPL